MPRLATILSLSLSLGACAASKPAARDEAESPRATRKPGEAKVAASPTSLLEKGGAEKVQAALESRGYSVGKRGRIDRKTKDALRAFQRDEKIAATGLPDQLTIRRLDLDPKDILGGYATSKPDELELEPR